MSTHGPALTAAAHTRTGIETAWAALAAPGGWFGGADRLAIAREARSARACALCAQRKEALSPSGVIGEHTSDTALAPAQVDAIHRIATDPGRLSQHWYDSLRADGIEAEELVEMTALVGVVRIADTLARGLGQPERALPEPRPGEPARRKVPGTVLERGWVPMVDPAAAEGAVKMMYAQVEAGAGFVFNVARALTSVPEALMHFFGAFLPNYTTDGPVRPGGLSRVQVELLASSTSAYNDCFY